jgi:hypothetical protein
MIYAFKLVPEEMRRAAVLGFVACLVMTAVIYSRGESVTSKADRGSSKQAFQQPKDRGQAEGWFIPTAKVLVAFEDKVAEIANTFPLPAGSESGLTKQLRHEKDASF